MTKIKKQTTSTGIWTDANGHSIPIYRVSETEKAFEKKAFSLAKEALEIQTKLSAFKTKIKQECIAAFDLIAIENNIDLEKSKGNFTFFNFDRSIKIERTYNQKVAFDLAIIEIARIKLFDYFDNKLSNIDALVKEIALSSFQNTKGRLDTNKILNLLSYRTKVNKEEFSEVCDLIEKAITNPGSRVYYRVFIQDTQGGYQNIDLNFSSVEELKAA
jgi:hypothetical protein